MKEVATCNLKLLLLSRKFETKIAKRFRKLPRAIETCLPGTFYPSVITYILYFLYETCRYVALTAQFRHSYVIRSRRMKHKGNFDDWYITNVFLFLGVVSWY